jgi:Acetyltransferase (GNAT) domain
MTVEILDPRADPEPGGWAEFQRCQRLHPVWDYQLMGIEARAAVNPALLGLARTGQRIVAAFAVTVRRRPRLVEVLHPWLVGLPGWTVAENANATREIVRTVERAVCRAAGIGCLGMVYRYAHPSAAAGRGRLAHASNPVAVLDNRFSTLDEWLGSLRGKRRSQLRGQLRQVAAAPDLRVRFAPSRQDLDGTELAALLRRHRAKFARSRLDPRTPPTGAYLHALVRRPDVHTLTYHAEDRLLAFATVLDHPETPVYQHWAALDREEGGRPHLYFDSYARIVEHVIDRRRAALSCGGGMLDLKAQLGFTPRPRQILLVPRMFAR